MKREVQKPRRFTQKAEVHFLVVFLAAFAVDSFSLGKRAARRAARTAEPVGASASDAYSFTYCPYGDDGIILQRRQATGRHAHSSLSSDIPLNENASVSAKPNEERNSSGIIASVGSFLMKCATPSLMLTTGIPSSIVSTNKSASRPVLVGIPIAQTPTASATSQR